MVFRALFTAFTLVLLLTTQPTPTYATSNKIVFDICEDYFEELDDARDLLCNIYIRAINDWRIYNLGLIEYLEEEGYKSKAETVEEHDAFGCNTTEISRADFIRHYLDYMQEHEELMEDNFIYTIGNALEPFCKKQDRKSEPAFYLEEDRHKKKS